MVLSSVRMLLNAFLFAEEADTPMRPHKARFKVAKTLLEPLS